jgi:DNA polymerase
VTREDKETLYSLLDLADRMLSDGARSRGSMPVFCDDPESTAADGVNGSGAAMDASTGGSTGLDTMQEIADAVSSCVRCELCRGRKNAVPGVGPARPLVLVVGEGPGADEDDKGEPFVGKAGQLLDKMLGAIGLSRAENCFIANIVKCRPPENRDPTPDEAAACAPFLEAQIRALRPKAILAVGRVAAQNLLKTQIGIGQLRGNVYDYGGIPLMPTYHPSALLRDETLKRPAWEDLKRFKTDILEDLER